MGERSEEANLSSKRKPKGVFRKDHDKRIDAKVLRIVRGMWPYKHVPELFTGEQQKG